MSTTNFEGFREGCPALFRHKVPGRRGPNNEEPTYHVTDWVIFQRDGKRLEKWDAGTETPDAIRVVPVDDYEASMWRDRVYAFTDEAAEAQRRRGESQVPPDKVFTLHQSRLSHLEETCADCTVHAEDCPLLARMMELVKIAEVQF